MKVITFTVSDDNLKDVITGFAPMLHMMDQFSISEEKPIQKATKLDAPPAKALEQFKRGRVKPIKLKVIQDYVAARDTPFTVRDLCEAFPTSALSNLRSAIKKMNDSGLVEHAGGNQRVGHMWRRKVLEDA